MAFDSIEKKRKYQREWRRNKRRTDELWHEREKAAKVIYGHPEFEGVRGMQARADLNERRWRFQMWEVAQMQRNHNELLELCIVNSKELYSPEFIFIYAGKKRYENLRSPLPVTCATAGFVVE